MSPAPHLRLGYGTNGLTDLRLTDALALLADLGYDGVGLTLDHMHLDPLAPDLVARTRQVRAKLGELGLGVTIETGARYVLDPRRKHGPSLIDPDPAGRAARTALLTTALRVAADLGAHAVHCFSGITPADTAPDTAWKRLEESLTPVLDAAADARIPLAIEPEPGHLLATLADFHHLRGILGDPEPLGLTLDIGHCQCLESAPPADCVRDAAPWLRHVQIEDMRRGVHEHLPFGQGEIDFPPVLEALAATGYQGLTVVELPRHSHAGPELARVSIQFLRAHASTFGSTGMVTPTREELDAQLPDPARAWLAAALAEAAQAADAPRMDPSPYAAHTWELRFASAGRNCGQKHADSVRTLLLVAARADLDTLTRLYRQGAAAERRAVLLALHLLVDSPAVLPLVEDALRTNDTRLVAAAVGPYAAAHLDPHSWRHAVLKCLFTSVPVDAVADLERRAAGDAELARMLADYAAERTAAGREVPPDLNRVLTLTGEQPEQPEQPEQSEHCDEPEES